jgi:PAS domain S-box-containing protein
MSIRYPLSPEELAKKMKEIEPLKRGFDMLQDHTIITDANANILYANQAVLRQTGWSPEEVVGKNPGDLWGGNMTPKFYKQLWHKIKVEKEPFIGAIKNRGTDGKERWQEIIISPVLDKDGRVKFFIGIEPDITERMAHEKFQEEFVTVLAHQLQDPLASIRWSLELLLTRGGLKEEQKKTIEEVYKSDKLLVDMIADMLVFSRMGNLEMDPQIIKLGEEVKVVVEAAKKKFAGKTWQVELVEASLTVGSPSLARQVFVNLVDNAAKFSAAEGGKIVVSLTEEPQAYRLSVRNNGTLIPEGEQDQIFKRLYQGTTSKSVKLPGAGLGLFITKQICDSFGWGISFHSPNAQGLNEFIVVMPKKPHPKVR